MKHNLKTFFLDVSFFYLADLLVQVVLHHHGTTLYAYCGLEYYSYQAGNSISTTSKTWTPCQILLLSNKERFLKSDNMVQMLHKNKDIYLGSTSSNANGTDIPSVKTVHMQTCSYYKICTLTYLVQWPLKEQGCRVAEDLGTQISSFLCFWLYLRFALSHPQAHQIKWPGLNELVQKV